MNLVDYTITIIWSLGAFAWILRKQGSIWTLRDIFFLTLSYYALCVPLDLLFGFNIPDYQGLVWLESESAKPYVAKILRYYLSCLAGFALSYALLPKCFGSASLPLPPDHKQPVMLPARSFIVFATIAFLISYITSFWMFVRRERNLISIVGEQHDFFRLITLIFTAAFLVYIWYLDDKKKALPIVLLGIVLSFVIGARTYAVITVLAYIARYKIKFSKLKLIIFALLAFLFANYGKFVANQVRLLYANGSMNVALIDIPNPNLSRIEGGLAYGIFAFELASGESPLLLGKTYIEITFQDVVSRYLGGERPERLTTQLMRNYFPDVQARGNNFSYPALSEAWLNFGSFGPLLIGILLGLLCRYFDSRPRGIIFITLFYFIMRFFRSDFASVFKLNIVIMGGLMLLMYLILSFAYYLLKSPVNAQRKVLRDH